MSAVIVLTPNGAVQEFTANLAQAAATYDLCTASGSITIYRVGIFVATAGATFTSVSIQSNQATTPFTILSAADGAVANLTANRSLPTTWNQTDPLSIRNGEKLQFTLVGSTGTGSLRVQVAYWPVSAGALLT